MTGTRTISSHWSGARIRIAICLARRVRRRDRDAVRRHRRAARPLRRVSASRSREWPAAGRRGARLAAITGGGAIPDTALYTVVAQPEGNVVGTVDEDFAVESLAGDVLLLGNTSWRIRRVGSGRVLVEDAHGAAPTIPFWRGEAPARTIELSRHVAEVRQTVDRLAPDARPDDARRSDILTPQAAVAWLQEHCGLDSLRRRAGRRLHRRRPRRAWRRADADDASSPSGSSTKAAACSSCIHAPFGGRINKAWGLALRKRFCRSFNFELQAAATDDGINIALAEQHSFPLADVFRFLSPASVQEVLEQAVLDVADLRHALALGRRAARSRCCDSAAARRVPLPIQRMQSDDLLASVFPDAAACQENIEGDIKIPDHPLIREVMKDVLTEAMDLDGLKDVLTRHRRRAHRARRGGHAGAVAVLARDSERQSVCVSGRRAARRAAGARGGDAPHAAGRRC